MLPDIDLRADVQHLLIDCRNSGKKLATLLENHTLKTTYPASTTLKVPSEAEYHIVTTGYVYYGSDEGTHRIYHPNDVFLISPKQTTTNNSFFTDFAAQTISISESELLAQQQTNVEFQKTWLLYEAQRTHLLLTFGQSLTISKKQVTPQLQQFAPGATIIDEGSQAEVVYVLVRGQATVSLGGKKIGTIDENEIFGEMAVLTHTNRSATVQAQTECLVQILDRDSFRNLITQNNQTLLEMATQLSKRIITIDKLLTNTESPLDDS